MQKFAFMKGMFYICRMFFGFRAFEIYSSARLVASCTNLFFGAYPNPSQREGGSRRDRKYRYYLVGRKRIITFATSYTSNFHNINDFDMKTRFVLWIAVAVLSFASCEKSPYEEEIEENTEQGGGNTSDNNDSDEETEWEDTDYDGDTPYEDPNITDGNDNNGDGYKTGDELNVTQFINAANLPGVYVTGYIVAACAQNKNNAEFTAPFTYSSAVLLADDPSERNVEKTISIQLKSGSKIRDAVNLDEHPENHGKRLRVFGYRTTYLGLKGIKDIGANNWELLD